MGKSDERDFESFKTMAKQQEALSSEVVKAVKKRRLRINAHRTRGVVQVHTLTEARALAAEQRREREAAEAGGYELEAEAAALPQLAKELLQQKQAAMEAEVTGAERGQGRPRCGDNSVIEEHKKRDQGDLCRMPSGGFYCPIGCAHVKSAPHCTANAGVDSEPCRHRDISRAFHVRDQVRAMTIL